MIELWAGAHTVSTSDPHPRPLGPEATILRSRVNAPPEQVRSRLATSADPLAIRFGSLAGGGWYELVRPPSPSGVGRAHWTGRALLHGDGLRLVRRTAVDIEVTASGGDWCEVSIRPVARHPLGWGARRLRRYLVHANALLDLLVRSMTTPSVEPATSPRSAGEPATTTAA